MKILPGGQSDKTLLITVLTLVVFGLVIIASASAFYAEARFGDQYFFFKRQLFFGVLPGLLALYFFQKADYGKLRKLSFLFFVVALVFLALVFVADIGKELYGARRWIQIGEIGFQPAEMFKLALVLYLAAWFEKKSRKKTEDFFEGFLPFVIIIALSGYLIIKQPDIGTFGVVVLTAMSIFFASGANLTHIFGLILAGAAGFFVLIKSAPYRLNRFLAFMNPDLDPKGIGYQVKQALIAIGSGGIFGVGLGHSRQKFNYLPEPVGDSIFAIIGEELGLVGCIFVITLFAIVGVKGYQIAKKAPDNFGKLVATGITSWIVSQAFINMMAISGIIPLTGVPLPFVSYGGTSIVFLLSGVGILINVSKKARI